MATFFNEIIQFDMNYINDTGRTLGPADGNTEIDLFTAPANTPGSNQTTIWPLIFFLGNDGDDLTYNLDLYWRHYRRDPANTTDVKIYETQLINKAAPSTQNYFAFPDYHGRAFPGTEIREQSAQTDWWLAGSGQGSAYSVLAPLDKITLYAVWNGIGVSPINFEFTYATMTAKNAEEV